MTIAVRDVRGISEATDIGRPVKPGKARAEILYDRIILRITGLMDFQKHQPVHLALRGLQLRVREALLPAFRRKLRRYWVRTRFDEFPGVDAIDLELRVARSLIVFLSR